MDVLLADKRLAIQDKGVNILEIVGDILKETSAIVAFRKKQPASVYPEIVNVWEEYMDVLDGGEPQWITTGLLDLDRQVCLVNGTHTIIGASPAEGKTSLGVCILRWVSSQGKRCAFFTLEQTRKRILQKIISQEAKVSHKRYITGRLTESEKFKIMAATNKWSNANMCVIDGRWSVAEIRQRAIQEKAENGLDMIIVDLLGLLKRPLNLGKDAKDHISYNESSKQLQDLAAELDIPIITMAHLNREKYKRPGNKPILSDLREAGEQFADIVIFLHREFNITKDPDDENIIELLIAKNRDGTVGYVTLGWHGESTTFYNLSKTHDEPEEKDMRIVLGGGIQND
jgi:replicative DNA helicase